VDLDIREGVARYARVRIETFFWVLDDGALSTSPATRGCGSKPGKITSPLLQWQVARYARVRIETSWATR